MIETREKSLQERKRDRTLTKPKFGADPGRRAGNREMLCKTMDYLVTRKAVRPEDAASFARLPDEDLTERVIAIFLREILSLELKMEAAADTLREADKFLELIQQQAEAEEKMEKAA
ncbi:MAG: hypothetical protein ABSH56_14700 [Bryobacteraceae bacterium]